MKKVLVTIFIGSDSNFEKMLPAKQFLDKMGVSCEMRITSAHRTPERTSEMVKYFEEAGCQVFICGAGMAAHLAGVVKSMTIKPVIGVPLTSKSSPLQGMDALYATVEMPSGMPVNTIGIDLAKNAAISAVEILALLDQALTEKLIEMRAEMKTEIEKKDLQLQENLKPN